MSHRNGASCQVGQHVLLSSQNNCWQPRWEPFVSGWFGFLIQVVSSSIIFLCWSFLDIMPSSRSLPPVLKDRACFSRLNDIFCFICESIHCSLVHYERRVTLTSCLAHLSSEVTNRDVRAYVFPTNDFRPFVQTHTNCWAIQQFCGQCFDESLFVFYCGIIILR